MPSAEDFLKLRETLKERERQKLWLRHGAYAATSLPSPDVKPSPPVPSSGKNQESFFGASEMLVPKRVLDSSQAVYQKIEASQSKVKAPSRPAKRPASVKKLVCTVPYSKDRVRFLKESRDYSCLFKSDEVEKIPETSAKSPSFVKSQTASCVSTVSDSDKAGSKKDMDSFQETKPQSRVSSTAMVSKQNRPSLIEICGNRNAGPNMAGKKHPETGLVAVRRHDTSASPPPIQLAGSKKATVKPKKRPREDEFSDFEDPDDVSATIRKMFGYDPSKYRHLDCRDDRGMEASFRTIEKEEKRSAKLAREEDRREQALIEEEERREREARKKRKLLESSLKLKQQPVDQKS